MNSTFSSYRFIMFGNLETSATALCGRYVANNDLWWKWMIMISTQRIRELRYHITMQNWMKVTRRYTDIDALDLQMLPYVGLSLGCKDMERICLPGNFPDLRWTSGCFWQYRFTKFYHIWSPWLMPFQGWGGFFVIMIGWPLVQSAVAIGWHHEPGLVMSQDDRK